MIEMRDDCVGCEVCTPNCPHKYPYYVFICDECGEELAMQANVYEIDEKQMCSSCAVDHLFDENYDPDDDDQMEEDLMEVGFDYFVGSVEEILEKYANVEED